MTYRISIVRDLPPSRWGRSHLPNKQPVTWRQTLKDMRFWWERGEDTELLSAFVDYFDKNPDPLRRRPPCSVTAVTVHHFRHARATE